MNYTTRYIQTRLNDVLNGRSPQFRWCALDDIIIGNKGEFCSSCIFQDEFADEVEGDSLCAIYDVHAEYRIK